MEEFNYELEQRGSLEWKDLTVLFEKVGWGLREPEEVRKSFGKSSVVCFVYYADDKLVAFGRTVDDGKYYALLVDIVVDPTHQGKGIGSVIIDKLKERLIGYNFITLTAAPGKGGFYEKIGWENQSTSYIWPKDEKQRKEHVRRKNDE